MTDFLTHDGKITPVTKAKHTPGPWELHQEDENSIFTIKADGEFVTHVTESRYVDNRFDEEAHANARLIAAAPGLLAELEQQKSRWQVVYNYSEDSAIRTVANAAIHQIDAAIAKATGAA